MAKDMANRMAFAEHGRWRPRARFGLGTAFAVSVLWVFMAVAALADGFHNAAMVTKSIDDWLADVKQAIPDLADRMSGQELRSGRGAAALQDRIAEATGKSRPAGPRRTGSLEGRLNAQQQALLARKSNDCLEILAYMDAGNIFPREFPDFPMQLIPRYREAAKELLGVMGADGTRAVAVRAREALMGAPVPGDFSDCKPHPAYHDDLVKVLADGIAAGHLTDAELQDLLEATEGQKTAEAAALAQKIRESLVSEHASLPVLLAVAEKVNDPALRTKVQREVGKRLKDASVLELFEVRESVQQPAIRRDVVEELGRRRPTYAEVKDDLLGIWRFAASEDRQTAEAAREQLVNAFQRAPMPHCLHWLGQTNDAAFEKLIWEQVDARIARADAERRQDYATTAVAVLKHTGFSTRSRGAALQLMARLKDRQAAGEVIEVLMELPRELWPQTGKTLRDITGQDFGPAAGANIVDVLESKKKWQQWWREQERK